MPCHDLRSVGVFLRGWRVVDVGVGDGVVEGRLGDDVMDACAGREKVEGRLPLEQMTREDFFSSMFNVPTGSFWHTTRIE